MVPWKQAVLTLLVLLLTAVASFFLLENHYVAWVRRLCAEQNVVFVGKFFRLFPSPLITAGMAVMVAVWCWLFLRCERRSRLVRSGSAVFLFLAATYLQAIFWAMVQVIECTLCDDGIRRMSFNEVPLDRIFLIGMFLSFLPFVPWRKKGRSVAP